MLTFRARQEGDQYAAESVEFEVASCGDTLESAFEAVREATALYLATLEREGALHRVVLERGLDLLQFVQ
jgi:predicted RNase H-like HicB family nuclease